MIADRIENWRQYAPNGPWRTAFRFLEGLTPESEPCDYIPIQGDEIFARIMRYPTRTVDEAILEAHDRYIDIQMSLVNAERIDWFPREELSAKTAYDPDTDVVLFHPPGAPWASVTNHPRVFSVFFPEDAHMAQLSVGGEVRGVKKAVVKLRADLIQ